MPANRSSPPAAVLLHGAGSSPRFVRAAFGPALRDAGVERIEAPWDRSGDVGVIADSVTATREALRGEGYRVAFVAGVSIGAHAAARWAAGGCGADAPDGLLLALPAWTGAPDDVAAATGAAAAELTRRGVETVLSRLRADPALADDWVLEQLEADWPAYPGDTLVTSLRQVARSAGPGTEALASIGVPCGVVALDDDPLHPADVAVEWSRVLPRASCRRIDRREPAGDLAVIGRAAVAAWREASGSLADGTRR